MMDFKHHDSPLDVSIKWRKKVLPRAHILIWMIDKIISEKNVEVILAEIPDVDIISDLFEVVTQNIYTITLKDIQSTH